MITAKRTIEYFLWPLCCMFFFDIRIMITTLVYSNSSYVGKTLLFIQLLLEAGLLFKYLFLANKPVMVVLVFLLI